MHNCRRNTANFKIDRNTQPPFVSKYPFCRYLSTSIHSRRSHSDLKFTCQPRSGTDGSLIIFYFARDSDRPPSVLRSIDICISIASIPLSLNSHPVRSGRLWPLYTRQPIPFILFQKLPSTASLYPLHLLRVCNWGPSQKRTCGVTPMHTMPLIQTAIPTRSRWPSSRRVHCTC